MKNIISKYFSDKKMEKTLALIGGILVLVMIVLIPFSLAIDTPIDRIEIKSENLNYDEKSSGSFKITKSAKWISKGKAQITFDVDTIMKTNTKYTDIILVLDISGSMSGEKLNRVKSDSIELINSLLVDSNNRVALITFETNSHIVSNLTNNKEELINKINNLGVIGNTNYYQALVNVDNILKDYQKERDREVITLFLTDGYPNEDTPNEESQYRYLKEQYPYINLNGVQYEMGSNILEPIKKISDNQFIADMKTLNNVLFDASVAPTSYDNFNITDYIDTKYFDIKNSSDIDVSQGKVRLDNNKINWTIDKFKSGTKAKMTIEVSLKDEYLNKGGIYPINIKEEVKSLIDGVEENITSTLTPKLKNSYQVIYDANAPEGCSVGNVPKTEGKSVFDTVTFSDNEPKCTGYKFRGWEIITEGVKKVNDDHFIMPEKDVTIRAEWSKVSVKKAMDGTVYEKPTLYKMMAQNSVLDNTFSEFVTSSTGIDFSADASDTNGKGVYELSSTKDDEYPVYYYRGAVTNNNVVFANYCWKIVRTTSTGGVKLIYNGVPDSNGSCNNIGDASQIGTSKFNSGYTYKSVGYTYVGYRYGREYNDITKTSSLAGFVFGNDVTYENGLYTLINTITNTGWDYQTKYHYTCLTTENTCSSVYYYYHSSHRPDTDYFFELSNGENIEDAKREMFRNTWTSDIKSKIDSWYQNNMTDYTDYLEDTIWCNDRSVLSGPLKGKDDGFSTFAMQTFSSYERIKRLHSPSIICPNVNDSFTVSGSNGNGALTYPVALLTADEATLAGKNSTSYLYTEKVWWTLSPSYIEMSFGINVFTVGGNWIDSSYVTGMNGVRPSVSLKPGTTLFDGDGTANDPYIIE